MGLPDGGKVTVVAVKRSNAMRRAPNLRAIAATRPVASAIHALSIVPELVSIRQRPPVRSSESTRVSGKVLRARVDGLPAKILVEGVLVDLRRRIAPGDTDPGAGPEHERLRFRAELRALREFARPCNLT